MYIVAFLIGKRNLEPGFGVFEKNKKNSKEINLY
jgi:hypothetical protein